MLSSLSDHMKKLLGSLKADGYKSYDHFDFWSTPAGSRLREKRNSPARPLVGAVYVLEILFPKLFRIGIKPKLSMETMPSLLRGMKIYNLLTGDKTFERDRQELFNIVREKLGASTSGIGLGHQFDWFTGTMINAHTPLLPLSADLASYILLNRCKDDRIPEWEHKILKGIGEFIFKDLGRVELLDGSSKVYYAERDRRYVINANSFAFIALLKLGRYLNRNDFFEMSDRLNNFVINQQNDDGSWFYFEKGSVPDSENFIDCFHTAFVIENLMEYEKLTEDGSSRKAVERGLDFFLNSIVNRDYSVNHFAKSHLPVKIVSDTRSIAEAINLLALAGRERPELLDIAHKIFLKAKDEMYDESGRYYYHRKYSFSLSKMNYHRWGSIPMLQGVARLAEAYSAQSASRTEV